jgi:hypothetical protein
MNFDLKKGGRGAHSHRPVLGMGCKSYTVPAGWEKQNKKCNTAKLMF